LPNENQWTVAASLPVALSAYALAEFEGKLYLMGGWDGNHYVSTVYEFDPAQDIWRQIESMPTARGFAGAAVIDNRIFVLGGYDGEKVLNVNEILIPGNSDVLWSNGMPLPEPRYGLGVVSFADVIYLIGGEDGSGGGQISYQYHSRENSWLPFESLQGQTWSHMGVQLLGSYLYLWGGELNGIQTNKLWSFQTIYTLVLPVIQQ